MTFATRPQEEGLWQLRSTGPLYPPQEIAPAPRAGQHH